MQIIFAAISVILTKYLSAALAVWSSLSFASDRSCGRNVISPKIVKKNGSAVALVKEGSA